MQKLTDVLAMGGYGGYVWPAYGVAAIVLFAMTAASYRSLRRAQKALLELQKGDET